MPAETPSAHFPYLRAFRGKYGSLLAVLIALLALLPLVTWGRIWGAVLSSVTSAVLVASIYAASPRRRSLVLALILAVAYLTTNELTAFGGRRWLLPVQAILAFTMLVYATVTILGAILESEAVTVETLQSALCVYLLLGVVWSFLFALIEMAAPGAFHSALEIDPAPSAYMQARHRMARLIYFSYATLTTLGYGDITPMNGFAQMAACLEAMAGQIYLTVLVARLVGLHIAQVPSQRS